METPARCLSSSSSRAVPPPPAAPPPMWNGTEADARPALRALTGCVLSALILWTLLGNVLVCAAVLRFRHLRTKVTNTFIVSLALSDLLVAVLVMPWKAAAEVAGYWPFGAFCNIWVTFDIMCSTASILNLCVISVDRYWAIASPFRYERKMTQRVAFVMIGVTWTLSVLISFIPIQLNWHKARAESARSTSNTADMDAPEEHAATARAGAPAREDCDSSLSREYAISSSLVSFYIPVAIMLVTYTRIYRIAQTQIRRIASLERAAEHAQSCRAACREHQQLQQQHHHQNHTSTLRTSISRETKVLKTLSVIMGVFVCCWLPFFVLNCVVPFCARTSPGGGGGGSGARRSGDASAGACVSDTTFDVFVWFGWTNSSLNPVIYAFNAEFRKAFASLLGCRRLCTSTPVETVNISNELVSYNQDTLLHKEIASAYVNIIPNVVECAEREDTFDRISQLSRNNDDLDDLATDSACELDRSAADISLDALAPFTPNGVR
ncbi:D(1) dopamine receptor [Colossoma macropomum]|uniref:D(1) dopamine receptor n=1 Tax=Colossoma macropomum TaxID=42526 RepID=UPI001863E251|nr:D(1) dopamine receptor [Colossoma macropomum]